MRERRDLIQAYLDGLGAAAIYIVGPAPGRAPITLGHTRNLPAMIGQFDRASWVPPITHMVQWCADEKFAARIVASAVARLNRAGKKCRDHWFDADPQMACESLLDAARKFGVPLQDDAEMRASAHAAISRVEAELEELKRAGGMKSVNKAYREYREETSARGERAQVYSAWLEVYKAHLVRLVAENARMVEEKVV